MKDVADGSIGFVVGGFQLTVGPGLAVWLVVEEAVGQGAAKLLVEEDEGEGDLGALASQPIGVPNSTRTSKDRT